MDPRAPAHGERRGGTGENAPDQLLIGMNMNNLLTLDPAAMTGNDIVGIVVNLYDPLIELDPQELTNVRPALATSWEVNDARDLITFHLRDGVKFHSGNPVTAEDLVWSMRRILHLNLAQASVWKSYGFTKRMSMRWCARRRRVLSKFSFPNPMTRNW